MDGITMDGLTEGRIVHYVLPDGRSKGEHRAAVIVRVWSSDGVVNLQVFTDGLNDGDKYAVCPHWETSIRFSADPQPNTWHWIEKA